MSEKKMSKKTTDLESLSSILLSTLDEGIFFAELSKYMKSVLKSDINTIGLIFNDESSAIIAKNGRAVKKISKREKGSGITGHVIKTKRAYISNNVQRDPLFASNDISNINAELCMPLICDGIVMGVIHFQNKSEEAIFSKEDIEVVMAVLKEIDGSLRNLKMYLAAKFLNQSLLKQIELKEKEIASNKLGLNTYDSYRIDGAQSKKIISKSDSMKQALILANKVADTNANVLLEGERGTGKEMIAKKIHLDSARHEGPFISLDCSVLCDDIALEAEIFGRADSAKRTAGLLERANNGTIFLNNIERLSIQAQEKLSNFIRDGLAFQVEGQTPYKSNVRVIVATSCELAERVERSEFREALFYQINTIRILIPSLRDRKEDLESLAIFFLNKGRSIQEQKALSPCVISALEGYTWPGNVRELENLMERAYILSEGLIVEKSHIADSIEESELSSEENIAEEEMIDFKEMTLGDLERFHICQTLEHLSGNKTKTAKALGITVKTLYNKLHSYGMVNTSKEA